MRKRNIRVYARLTEEEYDTVARRIRKTGLSSEAYIRSVLLGSVPKEKPDERFYAVMRELSGIANDTSRLAWKAVSSGFADAWMLLEAAEKWSRFQVDVRREFLLPEKL